MPPRGPAAETCQARSPRGVQPRRANEEGGGGHRVRREVETPPRYTPLPCPCIHGAPECEGVTEAGRSQSPALLGPEAARAQATTGVADEERSGAGAHHPSRLHHLHGCALRRPGLRKAPAAHVAEVMSWQAPSPPPEKRSRGLPSSVHASREAQPKARAGPHPGRQGLVQPMTHVSER